MLSRRLGGGQAEPIVQDNASMNLDLQSGSVALTVQTSNPQDENVSMNLELSGTSAYSAVVQVATPIDEPLDVDLSIAYADFPLIIVAATPNNESSSIDLDLNQGEFPLRTLNSNSDHDTNFGLTLGFSGGTYE